MSAASEFTDRIDNRMSIVSRPPVIDTIAVSALTRAEGSLLAMPPHAHADAGDAMSSPGSMINRATTIRNMCVGMASPSCGEPPQNSTVFEGRRPASHRFIRSVHAPMYSRSRVVPPGLVSGDHREMSPGDRQTLRG